MRRQPHSVVISQLVVACRREEAVREVPHWPAQLRGLIQCAFKTGSNGLKAGACKQAPTKIRVSLILNAN